MSCTGLNVEKVNKYYPDTDKTPKGNMRKVRQGIRSTKEKVIIASEKYEKIPHRKHQDIYVTVDQFKDTIYTDQTGKFPIASS